MTDSGQLGNLAGALVDWLPNQRWFAGKDRPVHAVQVVSSTELASGDPRLLHVIVEVDSGTAAPDRYQLIIGGRIELPEHLLYGLITTADRVTFYDAVHDPDLTGVLLDLICTEATVGQLRFRMLPDAKIDPALRSRPVGADQSNTSLVYGQQYILKLFRRLQPGISPDLELHRALHEVGCEHIAMPLGWIEGSLDGEPTTFGMLSEFLPNTANGWAMATTSVRDLMAERDLHAHEVGGDFAAEAHRLGQAVAAVHADLDAALGRTEAGAEQLDAALDAMHARLDAALDTVPALAKHEPALRAAFDTARNVPLPLPLQRIHGDLHLGQALRTPLHWVLIDFEGEPLEPMTDRRSPGSTLRDVAGMLRSFDYAAHQALINHPADPHTERQQAIRALEWSERNRSAFIGGYTESGTEIEPHSALLRAFELDKAVYEVGYEASNRPDWLPIPLTSIARLAAQTDDD